MRSGKEIFRHGLTIVYVYPDNGSSIVQMHFGFEGVYGQRQDATLTDALVALEGIREDLGSFKNWMGTNVPDKITGSTSTNLLIKILKNAGFETNQEVEGGATSFRIETKNIDVEKVLQKVAEEIQQLLQRGKEIKSRRTSRAENE